MAFTYDVTELSANKVYQVRFKLGDTIEEGAVFQDEEIEFVLHEHADQVLDACIDCVSAIIPKIASDTGFTVGPYSEDGSAANLDYWARLLTDLKAQKTQYNVPISNNPTGPPIFRYNLLGVDDYGSWNKS